MLITFFCRFDMYCSRFGICLFLYLVDLTCSVVDCIMLAGSKIFTYCSWP